MLPLYARAAGSFTILLQLPAERTRHSPVETSRMKTSCLTSRCVRFAAVTIITTICLLAGSFAQSNAVQQRGGAGNVRGKAVSKAEPAELEKISAKLALSKPANHSNLTIYMIEGDDRLDTKNILTLGEALGKTGTVKVKETGQVNELLVENTGNTKSVFIMAGDIVKGGRQDRTLGVDLTLAPKSGTVPISSFCVEQGRWAQRGGESVGQFSTSVNAIVGNAGKIAVRSEKEQGKVWEKVAEAQTKISSGISKSVAAPASPSSLQLSLEDGDLKKTAADYAKAMKPLIEENERAIGYVAVINGSIHSAEIFAGHDLFRRLWPKLIETTSIEAISEKKGKQAVKAATAEDAKEFLEKAEAVPATAEKIHGDFWSISAVGTDTAVFQTVDKSKDGLWLRRSLLKK